MGVTCAAVALEPMPSAEIATSADAMRPPNKLITFPFALWLAGGPLEALNARLKHPAGDRPSCLSSPAPLALGSSLPIAEGQICYVYRESNHLSVNRSRLGMEFGTLSICSVFSSFPQLF